MVSSQPVTKYSPQRKELSHKVIEVDEGQQGVDTGHLRVVIIMAME